MAEHVVPGLPSLRLGVVGNDCRWWTSLANVILEGLKVVILAAEGKELPTFGSGSMKELTTNMASTGFLGEMDVVSGNLFVLTTRWKTFETTSKVALRVFPGFFQDIKMALSGVVKGMLNDLFRQMSKTFTKFTHGNGLELVVACGIRKVMNGLAWGK